MFSGFNSNIENLSLLSSAKSRSISPENFTGEKGKGGMATEGTGLQFARDLGVGWKISPSVHIKPGETCTIADIKDMGMITHMWFAGYVRRDFILRIYWDDQSQPSVECPLPDFFAKHWISDVNESPHAGPFFPINSMAIVVNPNKGLNSFWQMPFKKRCLITITNINPLKTLVCYYQIDYTLCEVPAEAAYFHAQFRRVNPLPYKEVYTILDGVVGQGQYVGTSMGWGINNSSWWGEGEIKFYLDGDEYPTICGTGTEDYFGGAYNWEVDGAYVTYTTPYMGMHEVYKPDGLYQSQHRHGMYRWHIVDPIRFEKDIKVTIQALGWRRDARYLPGMHDICSTAYWYQTLPTAKFPEFPDRDSLEIT